METWKYVKSVASAFVELKMDSLRLKHPPGSEEGVESTAVWRGSALLFNDLFDICLIVNLI